MQNDENTVSDQQNDGSATTDPSLVDDRKKEDSDAGKQLLKDMMKYKVRSRDLETKLEEASSKIDLLQKDRLEEKEDYKALYEAEVNAHKETKRRADGLKQNVTFSEKHRAVYPVLKKAGLVDRAEKLITEHELEKLEIEVTSTGRFNVVGIDTFVEDFKNEHPYAFSKNSAPVINSGSTGTVPQGTKVTAAMVIAAENKPEYKNLYEAYKKQQKGL